jgi:hypothetical protein
LNHKRRARSKSNNPNHKQTQKRKEKTKLNMPNPIFVSTSNEKPQLLTISFEDDPQGSLGAQLINCDKVSMICVEVEENI